MISFEYEAKAKDGTSVKGIVEAESENTAAKLLVGQGLTPIHVKAKAVRGGLLGKVSSRISAKDRIIFTRQLATMINAGLPLTQSLRTVQEQSSSKALRTVVGNVISSVEGGTSFAESLEKHPEVFSAVYVALVSAGEASGTLDKALDRIALQQEKDADIISKVRGALVYPLIVVAVIAAVVIFLLTTVVPQIKLIYQDFNKDLPFLTGILIGAADILINFWWLIILITGAAIFFLVRWSRTDGGELVVDKFKLSVPLFGDLFQKLYMARFCRTGETLMSSGVMMLETLRITAQAVDNVWVEKSIDKAAQQVKGGKALSLALKAETETFLPLVPQMIHIGEQSGAIDKMMDKAATYYEQELDNKIKAISTTIEPILMVVLAVVVGGIVLAILLPVYNLASESVAG